MRLPPTIFLAVCCVLASCAPPTPSIAPTGGTSASELAAARASIDPLFKEMYAAANAHDTDRHLSVYARTPDILFVINTDTIQGWDALRAQQLVWWQNGKSDVVYQLVAPPSYRMPAAGLVVQSYVLSSHRTVAGASRDGRIAVTALWQNRSEGWRIVYAQESAGPK